MKPSKLLLLLVAILIPNFSHFAQNDSLNYKRQLQFHLINGYSLSYLNLFCPSSGLRFKVDLGFNGSSENSDHIQDYSANQTDTQQKFNQNQSNNSQNLNLTVNYLWISNLAKEINFYLGIGPLISYSRRHNENNSETTPSSGYTYSKSINETTSSFFGLGIQGVVGIECNLTEKISLLAEFNLDGTYSWDHWQTDYEDQTTSLNKSGNSEDGNSWNYGLNNLKIGIAYRF